MITTLLQNFKPKNTLLSTRLAKLVLLFLLPLFAIGNTAMAANKAALSSDAMLKSLNLTTGTISPAFSSNTFNYNVTVSEDVNNFYATPVSNDANYKSITINGSSASSGNYIYLSKGANSIVITAQDGVTKLTYTVNVTYTVSTDASLSILSLGDKFPLIPTDNTNLNYKATVPANTLTVPLSARSTSSYAKIAFNGSQFYTQYGGRVINLNNTGSTILTVFVKAADSVHTHTYTISVSKAISTNDTVKSIVTSTGANINTASGVYNYFTQSAPSATSVTFNIVAQNANSTIKINGQAVLQATTSQAIPLNYGDNNIQVVVTAQDGITANTYTVNVNRPHTYSTALNSIVLNPTSNLVLKPGSSVDYIAQAPVGYNSIRATITTADPKATLVINGQPAISGILSSPIPLNLNGVTVINISIIAADGSSVQTYTITVNQLSNDSSLKTLSVSTGTQLNGIANVPSAGVSFSALVESNVTSLTVDAVADNPNAIILVNGVQVASGVPSQSIQLNPYSTVIFIKVTSQDGTSTYTYSITVIHKDAYDASLSTLSLNTGSTLTLKPSSTVDYLADVPSNVSVVTVTPTTQSIHATVKVNGQPVVSGNASQSIALNSTGSTGISIVVTAADGTDIDYYTITVSKALSADASLTNLVASVGTSLVSTGKTSYTTNVANIIKSIKIKAITEDSTATIKINGLPVSSGAFSSAIPLNYGANTINVVVTAQNGTTTQTYSIQVTRAPASTIASLALLEIAPLGNLIAVPGSNLNYTTLVASTTTAISVIPYVNDTTATLQINGQPAVNAAVSKSIALNSTGPTVINILVTAADGIHTNNYTITVTKAASNDASLSSLIIGSYIPISPITGSTVNYQYSVDPDTRGFYITINTTDLAATIKIGGATHQSADEIVLTYNKTGTTNIPFTVIAADGVTTKAYNFALTVIPPAVPLSNNAALATLSTSSGSLTATSNLNFTTTVSAATPFTVKPTAQDTGAVITVNGVAVKSGSNSQIIALSANPTIVNIKVTAANGVSIDTYTITVNTLSNDATLSSLFLTQSPQLTTTTGSADFNYTASVLHNLTSVNVTGYTNNNYATIQVNGINVANGVTSQPISLNQDSTLVKIKVTAQDRVTIHTYAITVIRLPASSNANIGFVRLIPYIQQSATSANSYSAIASSATTAVQVNPFSVDNNATIKVNGLPVANNAVSQSIALSTASPTLITVTATAQDSVHKSTYTISVTKASPTDATIRSIFVNTGGTVTLAPGSTTNYKYVVTQNTPLNNIEVNTTDLAAGIKINGVATSSGADFNISYNSTGTTNIPIVITSADGTTTKTYNLTIVVPPQSNNAMLASLSTNLGALTATGNLTFTTSVSLATSSITINAIAQDTSAYITIGDTRPALGSNSQSIELPTNPTGIIVTVVSNNGVITNTYTVIVNKTGSNDPGIKSLTVSSGTSLVPAGGSSDVSYSTYVNNNLTSISITAIATDANSTIKVNGLLVASGSPSQLIPLNSDRTIINILVTAADGITQYTYAIGVNKIPSNNAALATLSTNIGSLTATSNLTYTTSVSAATTLFTVKATAQDTGAVITVNGITVKSGSSSPNIPLVSNPTVVNIKVTAADGISTHTYTITVNKAGSNNASLATLSLSAGALKATSNLTYTTSVSPATTSVTVLATAQDANATIQVNGVSTASGAISAPIALTTQTTVINIAVTAQDGVTSHTYSITVSKSGSSDASLKTLSTSAGALTATSNLTYTTSVAATTNSITITPTATDATAVITINGTTVASGVASQSLALNSLGTTAFNVKVTAGNGVTTNTYTINVSKAGSNDASLTTLALSSGTSLTRVTGSSDVNYTSEVGFATGALTVTPVAEDKNATITINGSPVLSGAQSQSIALNVGVNIINMLVTAQDGVSKHTYSIAVTRDAAAPADVTFAATAADSVQNQQVAVHPAVSPNGDGINDFLLIEGINAHPDNKITIINRNGGVVYETKGYNNSSKMFDGHSSVNGSMQPQGTYLYVLDYTDGDVKKHLTGYIILKY